MIVEADVQEKLRHLPPGLMDTYSLIYEQMFSTLGNQSRLVMQRVLKWLLCAQKQLSTDEFVAAISLEPSVTFTEVSKQQILNMCRNFVVLDEQMDVFRFAHLSVREFLEQREEDATALAHSLAAETCLRFCLDTPSGNNKSETALSRAKALREYAILYWATHCRMSGKYLRDGNLGQLFKEFVLRDLDEHSPFGEWTYSAKQYLQSRPWNDALKAKWESSFSLPPNPLFVGCVWGLLDLVEFSLQSKSVASRDFNSRGQSALRIASEYGQYDIVKLLVDRGADVTALCEDGSTALHVAAGRGNKAVAQLLLEDGSTPRISDGK
jgi:hypothetical protein